MLKISLLFKKFTNFTGKYVETSYNQECEIFRVLFLYEHIHIGRFSNLHQCTFKNFANFTGKNLCQSIFFNKVADLRPVTLLKKRLWNRCFPMKFAKFLRTPFFKEHLCWLLLKFRKIHQKPPVPESIFQQNCRAEVCNFT